MLKISEQELKFEAKSRGYRPEMIEKVYHLLNLLEEFMAVPYLSDRLVLKGGTAINLFCTDQFPRLSVDLDFNYIGSIDKNIMQQEKPVLENIMMVSFITDKNPPVITLMDPPKSVQNTYQTSAIFS